MSTIYPSGIAFPFRFRAAGGVEPSDGGKKVADNLETLIKTRVKERLIRKSVGTIEYDKVFRSAINESGLIESLLREAVIQHEPRAVNPEIRVYTKEVDGAMHVMAQVNFIFKYTSDPVVLTTRLI